MGRKVVRWGVVLVVLAVLGVLGIYQLRHPPRLPAVPLELTTRAVIPGIPGARYFVTADLEPFVQDILAGRQREEAAQAAAGHPGELGSFDFLAVSGGGDNGAFGAGLLCGWSDAGNRPTFKAVTGVSTGALIAPFAFLGPEYDHVLRTVYTSVRPTDISASRNFLAAINNDGMADNRPLWTLISKFVDDDFLKKIAAEYGKGRFLLIGTTNLDARIPVIWNMGAIASSGSPRALEVFRDILVASAAIPGAFPPTMMHVEVDGKPYDEMHVDGGASAQVFMYPPRMRATAAAMGIKMARTGRVYVIRNASLSPDWAPVERRTINIAGRAIASLIHTQGLGDLNRIYLQTQQDGLDFNLAIIGSEFQHEHKEEFDTAYMQALFDYGYNLSKGGYPWKKTPPGFDAPVAQ
jgi:predicted acylesterase/phospholipase RssA